MTLKVSSPMIQRTSRTRTCRRYWKMLTTQRKVNLAQVSQEVRKVQRRPQKGHRLLLRKHRQIKPKLQHLPQPPSTLNQVQVQKPPKVHLRIPPRTPPKIQPKTTQAPGEVEIKLTQYVKDYTAAGKVCLDTVLQEKEKAYDPLYDRLQQLGTPHKEGLDQADKDQVFSCISDRTGMFLSQDAHRNFKSPSSDSQVKPRRHSKTITMQRMSCVRHKQTLLKPLRYLKRKLKIKLFS